MIASALGWAALAWVFTIDAVLKLRLRKWGGALLGVLFAGAFAYAAVEASLFGILLSAAENLGR